MFLGDVRMDMICDVRIFVIFVILYVYSVFVQAGCMRQG